MCMGCQNQCGGNGYITKYDIQVQYPLPHQSYSTSLKLELEKKKKTLKYTQDHKTPKQPKQFQAENASGSRILDHKLSYDQ